VNMDDDEWKSNLAFMLPFTAFAVSMGVAFIMVAYMNGSVEIERLRLAQMQYHSEFVAIKEGM